MHGGELRRNIVTLLILLALPACSLAQQPTQEEQQTITQLQGELAARGRSTFSELRWYPPMEAAKGSLSWVFQAKQPESVRTGP